MEILDTRPIHGGYLTMYERTYSHQGRTAKHWFVSRGRGGPAGVHTLDKKPDAVIIVAFHQEEKDGRTFVPPRLVLTDEFRVPIGTREISFPAGIIDNNEAPEVAAFREMFEETGLTFTPVTTSPVLYSSAGLTDESCCIVLGNARGTPSSDNLEPSEDIHTMLLTHEEVCALLERKDVVFSKVAWPFLWNFKLNGFPIL